MNDVTITAVTVHASEPLEYQDRDYAKGDELVVTPEERLRLLEAGMVTDRYPFGLKPNPADVIHRDGRRFVRLYSSPNGSDNPGSFVDEEALFDLRNKHR